MLGSFILKSTCSLPVYCWGKSQSIKKACTDMSRNIFLAKIDLYPPLYLLSYHPFYFFHFMYGSLKLSCFLIYLLVYFTFCSLKHKLSQGGPLFSYSSVHC